MEKDIFRLVLNDFHDAPLPPLTRRQLTIPLDTGKIISIIGARRSGKTYFLFQVMKDLLDAGKKTGFRKKHIVYINFEDERLDFKKEELDLILQVYRECYPGLNLEKTHFFFDEIQNVDGWERFVRRVHDTVSKNIYITGSNSKLLSKEIATSLRGRSLTYEIFPLSFREYLKFNRVKADYFSSRNRAAVKNTFNRFIEYGGFPEPVDRDDSLIDKMLQEYYNTIIFRDLVERYDIKQVHILKFFLKRLFASITKDISVNKIYNQLKSQGLKVGKNLLYEFLDAIETIYLMIILKKYDDSIVKQELAEKKAYCIDNGLLNAVTFRFHRDKGKLLENLIAVELLKEGKNIFFYRNRGECDFIITEKDRVCSPVQVCLTLNDLDTRQREIKGLVSACERFKLPKGFIITDDEEETIKEKNIEINVLPAFKYLLG
jgi:predicted AAA+ superfamily ATPase